MADSSTQPSHPRRSEPISKPAGLHLKKRPRLSHVRGPPPSTTFESFLRSLIIRRRSRMVVPPNSVGPSLIIHHFASCRSKHSLPLRGLITSPLSTGRHLPHDSGTFIRIT